MLILSLLFMNNVEYVECNQEQLVLIDENVRYDIDFFNVIFYEDSNRMIACRYMYDAETIELEKENHVLNGYYIYIDGRLLQEVIVKEGLGKQNIHYVGYLHNFEKEEQIVMNDYNNINRNNRSLYILGILFLFLLSSLGFMFLLKV